jgi:nucleotide-binding universal stress UspA family protein
MKVLIGYDGSDGAEAALDDLKRAGLPNDTEALVLTVADVFLPPEDLDEGSEQFNQLAVVRRAHEHAKAAIKQARSRADRAAERLALQFPEWRISVECDADSPAWAIIRKAEEWSANLVVVGSQGRSAFSRFVLGSVSQKVLYESRTSVRIGRGRVDVDDSPIRLVVGVDTSPDALAAVDEIASRQWPAFTEVKLVAALDALMTLSPDPQTGDVMKWIDANDEKDLAWARSEFNKIAEPLRAKGLITTVSLTGDGPKRTLLNEAENWHADAIFVGARGTRGWDRILLGSVSSAVAARAHCSVEVVRKVG